MVRYQAGRFVSRPVSRTNLHADLVGFLSEVLVVESQDPPVGVSNPLDTLAYALIVNVLDAHLDATYWQGRQNGYGEHHGSTPVSPLDASLDENNYPTGAAS